jgi:hypothetical protein
MIFVSKRVARRGQLFFLDTFSTNFTNFHEFFSAKTYFEMLYEILTCSSL